MYERIKKWFEQGLWTEQMVRNAEKKNVLTKTEVEEILAS